MMSMLWVVLFVALIGFHLGCGLPVRPTPQTYPQDAENTFAGWGANGSMYAMVPALALVLAVVSVLFGCTWCYRHKDCKPNEAAETQLFTAGVGHLHEARRSQPPPDSGFSEPANNNISEDNNNGPISLREMQNIANNNAAAYIVSENEERNRVSRESVVEFEPLPTGIRVLDPLERCADWFGSEDFPRNSLQYLREINRGWFGRVVEGEIEESGSTTRVAVKILNQNASLEDKARFLDEAKLYRDVRHENVLAFIGKYLQEDPWILIFEFCSMDLHQFLTVNRPKMAILNESGVPLRLMCDVTTALAHLHSRGYLYGNVLCSGVLIRGGTDNARAVLGRYALGDPRHDFTAPETRRHPPLYTASSEVWSLGTLVWEVCAWGLTPARHPPTLPDLPCPYRNHLYQVMQLCWNPNPEARPTAAQVQALINHLFVTHTEANEPAQDDGYGSSDFEERWQRLKPNSIPKVDEHIAIIHAPSTSMASHFTGSDQDLDNVQTINDTLSIDMDTAVSRSSSIMSDKSPLSVQMKSESLNNLHGSLEDVRNIYLMHNETAVLDCHQGNIILEESKWKENDKSDSSVDPWLKDIMAGSQDDVSYFKDVSDVIKNLDNILNSEKTSSSESSHHASPSRDNLVLDCKKDYSLQSSLVKSPGITNFQNITGTGFDKNPKETESCTDNDTDGDTLGTLSHSFERHSDTGSQQTLENLTPDTPMKDIEIEPVVEDNKTDPQNDSVTTVDREVKADNQSKEIPNGNDIPFSENIVPKLKELCLVSVLSVSVNVKETKSKDCRTTCDSMLIERTDIREETKSINVVENLNKQNYNSNLIEEIVDPILPNLTVQTLLSRNEINMPSVIENESAVPQLRSPLTSDMVNMKSNSSASNLECKNSYDVKETGLSGLIEKELNGINYQSFDTHNSTFGGIRKPKKENSKVINEMSQLERDSFINNEIGAKIIQIDKPVEELLFDNDVMETQSEDKRKLSSALQSKNETTNEVPYSHDKNNFEINVDNKLHINIPNKHDGIKSSCISVENNHEIACCNSNQEYNLENITQNVDSIQFQNRTDRKLSDNITLNESRTDLSEETSHHMNIVHLQEVKADVDEILLNANIQKHDASGTLLGNDQCQKLINEIDNELEIKHIESVFTFLQYEFPHNSDSESTDEMNQSLPDGDSVDKIIEDPFVFAIKNGEKSISVQNQKTACDPEVTIQTVSDKNSINIAKNVGNLSPLITDTQTEEDLIERTDSTGENQDLIKESTIQQSKLQENKQNELFFNHKTIVYNFPLQNEIVPNNIDKLFFDTLDAERKPMKGITYDTSISTEQIQRLLKPTDSMTNIDVSKSEHSNNSSVYLDLIATDSELLSKGCINDEINEVPMKSCVDFSIGNISLINNESTVYLDLPSFGILKNIDDFLHMERVHSGKNVECSLVSSTPIVSDSSAENAFENSIGEHGARNLCKTNQPDDTREVASMKLDQTFVPESMSPFESPTKSHHTDTFDENSSVVLGPFETCSLELFKGLKTTEFVDFPRDDVFAFSSNYSEMNLETPSPLRDSNFLNEVPDIAHEDFTFDNIALISEVEPEDFASQSVVIDTKDEHSDPQTETNTDESEKSVTEKHVSPLTPPNSPGVFTLLTSQQKYLVDIDLNNPTEPDYPTLNMVQNDIDLNQIELQITSKLAMAENENNLNIEYSGPLIEEVESEGTNDTAEETYLAGNYGSGKELNEGLTLDEACVQALRNELELKLPLAQVAAIEPQCENEWSLELPPPPELIVSYPGALSPIVEETGQQLCAYENDANWNTSTRTDSSESYPEPCNNSTDEATDLPTGVHSEPRSDQRSDSHSEPQSDTHKDEHSNEHHVEHSAEEDDLNSQSPSDVRSEPHEHSTYTVCSREHSPNITYTVQKDVESSKEMTMSADSLNASRVRTHKDIAQSIISEMVDNKNEDEKESNCERISQISPFLLSPTTDTSAPENSDNLDNATGVSTLSKTTLATDAKISKPTECLSKATSIDSWCSNDTLYNVEENFDDLAMDPELPIEFAKYRADATSESTDTLTHNDDEKELSHCSTYILHDSKSEICETFSPDSITVNDNYTYTKVKTELTGTTPSINTKSDDNDTTKNSQTKDLAYGTLMSGLPSYSNCTTDIPSAVDNVWKLPQPELVRRSPIPTTDITPPKVFEDKELNDSCSPELHSVPQLNKMESVEMICLHDNFVNSPNIVENQNLLLEGNDSSNLHYINNMTPSVTSTPFIESNDDSENAEVIPISLPIVKNVSSESTISIPNFDNFQMSVEYRPQELSSNRELVEGGNNYRDSIAASERTSSFTDFESSAITKAQNSKDKSSHIESGTSSQEFRYFEDSVRSRPQDLSSLIDASSLFLISERMCSELATYSISNDQMTNSGSRLIEPMQTLNISPPNHTNLIESQSLVNVREPANTFLISFDVNDEIEQPHSIIVTEAPLNALSDTSNLTFDSHTKTKVIDLNQTYDSHENTRYSQNNGDVLQPTINGESDLHNEKSINQCNAKIKLNTQQTVKGNQTGGSQRESADHDVNDKKKKQVIEDATANRKSEKYATVNFLNETFEELIESSVDDTDVKDNKTDDTGKLVAEKEEVVSKTKFSLEPETSTGCASTRREEEQEVEFNAKAETGDEKMSSVTDNFLQNEKKFCQLDSYFPLLSDIRFTGPATEIMSTSFTQDSPTEPMSTECEQEGKPNDTVGTLIKEWDSDSDSSNSSSGEFIWKGGDGLETSVVPTTHFQHQRDGGSQSGPTESGERGSEGRGGDLSDGSGDSGSGSGSEGDEVEFVPSSWDCRAAPSKSSLRSLEQAAPDSKKRVVFKRQKYHCVYEYPREMADVDALSPAPYLPDFSTYSDWDPTSAEEAELGYGQLFGGPSPLDMYPLRSGIAFGSDYDEDFFISSSARPFESLGIMSTTSQFFPGMHVKSSLLERDLSDDVTEEFPPPPSPLPTTLIQTRTPSLDFTTPDSGVEDITPISTTDEDFKAKKLPETEQLAWRTNLDSASSSESVSPSSPGGEALGGLRHTRDKLKLDLPPSPHIPSPRHNRVFNFVLDKPKRRSQDTPVDVSSTPLVMTEESPVVVTTTLPLQKTCEDSPKPEPTFSTFGKSVQKAEPEQKIILTEDVDDQKEVLDEENCKVVEAVKGEGTVLDSGDEDSGIESSSKATLERNNKASNVS